MAGMKYREIAEKYGVSISTVKSWKVRHEWSRKSSKSRKSMRTKSRVQSKKVRTESRVQKEPEQKKNKEDAGEIQEAKQAVAEAGELNEKQRLFALYFFRTHNATSAYQKAYGCRREVASSSACQLLKNPKVGRFIRKMQQERDANLFLDACDVVELYMRIAFADYNDYVSVKDGEIENKSLGDMDGQIIESVMPTKGGVIVKLADRMKALNWLAGYFELNPTDRHRIAYQNKLAELREREVKAKEEGW